MTNYLANSWTPTAGCQRCAKNKIDLATVEVMLFFHLMSQENRVYKEYGYTCALCMIVVAYRQCCIWVLFVVQDSELPVVYVSLHIEHATPFLDRFFTLLAAQEYPKNRMYVLIHNMVSTYGW